MKNKLSWSPFLLVDDRLADWLDLGYMVRPKVCLSSVRWYHLFVQSAIKQHLAVKRLLLMHASVCTSILTCFFWILENDVSLISSMASSFNLAAYFIFNSSICFFHFFNRPVATLLWLFGKKWRFGINLTIILAFIVIIVSHQDVWSLLLIV